MTGPQPAPTVVDGVDIDAVYAAVTACPGVARVGSPGMASLTTYLPGRRIPGIRINPDAVEVEVVAVWGATTTDIAGQVRLAVRHLLAGRPVDITIADIDLPGDDAPSTAQPSAAALPTAPQPTPVLAAAPQVPVLLPPPADSAPPPLTAQPESEL